MTSLAALENESRSVLRIALVSGQSASLVSALKMKALDRVLSVGF